MSLASGTRLGPYEILGLIGAGGMGEVYKARDTRLDRTVALKILPPELSADSERRARFEREARAIASLAHPHICTLFDIGTSTPSSPQPRAVVPAKAGTQRGWTPASAGVTIPPAPSPQPSAPVHYLVMEHLAGETLESPLFPGLQIPLREVFRGR